MPEEVHTGTLDGGLLLDRADAATRRTYGWNDGLDGVVGHAVRILTNQGRGGGVRVKLPKSFSFSQKCSMSSESGIKSKGIVAENGRE